jgi:hypothetical protein
MTKSGPLPSPLVLQNDHTGEHMEMIRRSGEEGEWLEVRASMPAHTVGPPLHLQRKEVVEIRVTTGSLSIIKDGRRGSGGRFAASGGCWGGTAATTGRVPPPAAPELR